MPPTPLATLTLCDETATAALARHLAPCLGAGDVLALSGPIGAGKSAFARALIAARLAACGLAEDIPSPTFTLVQTYHAGALEIWHCDLYRLTSADEIWELGLEVAFESALTVIEWPERLGPALPDRALRLEFAAGRDAAERRLALSSDRAADWSERLQAAGLHDAGAA